jgi:hypothetical protein
MEEQIRKKTIEFDQNACRKSQQGKNQNWSRRKEFSQTFHESFS